MKYFRCKCGKCYSWTSGGEFPQPCEGCKDCNTTLEEYPDMHEEIKEHILEQRFNERTGEPDGTICTRCYRRFYDI